MNILTRLNIRQVVWVLGLAVVVLGSSAGLSWQNSAHAEGKRIVTVHADGQKHSVSTDVSTVGQALQDAEVKLGREDMVEPARDRKLTAKDYTINVYRSRPVLVVDGSKRFQVTTPLQSPEQVAQVAKVTTFPEDKLTLRKLENSKDGAGQQLTIERSVPVDLFVRGGHSPLRTKAKTVAEFLKFKEVKVDSQDTVLPAPNTPIRAGMKVAVFRDEVQVITEDYDIPFSVETTADHDHEVGYHEVREPGVTGRRKATIEIQLRDGKEIGRKEVKSQTTTEPRRQLEAVGDKPKPVDATCMAAIQSIWPAELQANAQVTAQHESGLRADAIGALNFDGSRDYGCFQINASAHPQFFANGDWRDPYYNAQYALQIYKGRGNWTAWYAVQGILW